MFLDELCFSFPSLSWDRVHHTSFIDPAKEQIKAISAASQFLTFISAFMISCSLCVYLRPSRNASMKPYVLKIIFDDSLTHKLSRHKNWFDKFIALALNRGIAAAIVQLAYFAVVSSDIFYLHVDLVYLRYRNFLSTSQCRQIKSGSHSIWLPVSVRAYLRLKISSTILIRLCLDIIVFINSLFTMWFSLDVHRPIEGLTNESLILHRLNSREIHHGKGLNEEDTVDSKRTAGNSSGSSGAVGHVSGIRFNVVRSKAEAQVILFSITRHLSSADLGPQLRCRLR